ncbi:unnamed protein product [Caenorhabditis bovis]|uniref:C2H2-type domain-containing protein n=1 Tax=Caenorhabditis bovis TaxID=2654633 RepID=A0A8S1F9X8_9PELO|nr:unnamed protein product [Caenorhabditis bovis]
MEPSSSSSASSISPTDLRRSKRNKFNLDVVAAIHGKKIKLEPLSVETEPSRNPPSQMAVASQPPPSPPPSHTSPDDGIRRSKRKSSAPTRDYFLYQMDTDEDDKGLVGEHQCKKCPARYETKSGLNNHVKLHGGEKRRFACELCDFSATTVKAGARHQRLHKHFGVVSQQNSPATSSSAVPAPEAQSAVKKEPTPPRAAKESTPAKEPTPPPAKKKKKTPTPPPLIDAPDLIAAADEPFQLNTSSDEDEPSSSGPPPLIAECDLNSRNRALMPAPAECIILKGRSSRKCSQCPFVAKSYERLVKHTAGHNMKKGYKCPKESCTYKAVHAGFLKRHYELHEGASRDDFQPWAPEYIDLTFERFEALTNKHIGLAQLNTLSVKNGFERICNIPGCKYQPITTTDLILHKLHVHKAREMQPYRRYICLECGQRFKSFWDRSIHKMKRHRRKPRKIARMFYLKELLGDVFFFKYMSESKVEIKQEPESLDDSMNSSFNSCSSKEGEELSYCDLCPYSAVTESRVKRHREKHFTVAEFKCQYCNFWVRSQEIVQQHERLHFKCEPPDETAAAQQSFTTEERVKLEIFQKGNNAVRLGDALKKWCKKSRLDRKIIDDSFIKVVVDGNKIFQCIDCPYQSKYRGDIRTHKTRHNSGQAFRCTQCTYSAQRPVSLRDHMRLHIAKHERTFQKGIRRKQLIVNNGHHIGESRRGHRLLIYCCNRCDYITSAVSCLWRHHRQHKRVPRVHVCSYCCYSSIDKDRMDEHIVVHSANGKPNGFARRVNDEGLPIPMITDYSNDLVSKKQNSPGSIAVLPNPDVQQLQERSSTPGSKSPQGGRTERSTRNKNNYYMMVNNKQQQQQQQQQVQATSKSQTPLMDLERFVHVEGQADEKKKRLKQPEKKIEEATHFAIRQYLKKEDQAEKSQKCPDCPYVSSDLTLFRLHRDMHFYNYRPRQFACCDCSFSAFTASSLQAHLQLHAPMGLPGTEGSSSRGKKAAKKTEVIPNGAKYFKCTSQNCNFKTVDANTFVEHRNEHRRALWTRLSTVMKRSGCRDDYQKPRMKFHSANKANIHCKKCQFRCVSMNAYISHVDRHGWNRIYKCRMCDYSDNTKSIVDFHETNHHISKELSLTDTHTGIKYALDHGFVVPPAIDGLAAPTPEEVMHQSGNAIKCPMCDFVAHLGPELAFHISQNHADEENAQEMVSYLQMGFAPPSNVVSSSCLT